MQPWTLLCVCFLSGTKMEFLINIRVCLDFHDLVCEIF